MLLQDFQNKMKTIKKGKFVKATWRSEKIVNGKTYEKVSNGVVRFVKYGNIKGVVVKGANNGDKAIIPNTLFQTSNGNLLVQMATTKIKTKCTYKVNGVEIDKTEYDNNVKSYGNGAKVVFRVKLENLLSLG